MGTVITYGDTICAAQLNKIYLSTDGGNTWNESTPLVDDEASFTSAIIKYENLMFVATYNGIYETSDNGANWIARNNGLVESGARMINDLEIRGDSLYAATEGAAVFVFNLKEGETWMPFRNGLEFGIAWNASTIYNMNGTLLAGAGGSGFIYVNSPGSDLWVEHQYDPTPNSAANYMLDFFEKDGIIIGASTQAEYRSLDTGRTWQKTYLGAGYIALARFIEYGSKIYLFLPKLNGAYIFTSVNLGETWELFDVQQSIYVPYDLAIYNNRLYTAGYDGLFYREMNPTSVDKETQPKNYTLMQNYPNPFNPETKLQYVISSSAGQAGRQLVNLKIYDILGKEVATLVNEEKSAGTYDVQFNASHLSSGVYYYKLTAGNYSETRKMILMK